MSNITPAGSGGAPVTTTSSGVNTPVEANESAPVAGTEYSYSFPAGTRNFSVRTRNGSSLQVAYVSGTTGTLYASVPAGCIYFQEELEDPPVVIYFRATKNLEIVEIESWS